MNRARMKSIIALIATLAIGIFLGLLIPPVIHRMTNRNHTQIGPPTGQPMHKNRWFVGTLNRVIQPDSVQAQKIKPITDWAAVRIDSIERSANAEMSRVLDSVHTQIMPLITTQQQDRLQNFRTRAQQRWRHGERDDDSDDERGEHRERNRKGKDDDD